MTEKQKPEGYTFGRPTDYRPEYVQVLLDHFDRRPYTDDMEGKKAACDFPTLAGFCVKIGVSRVTVFKWMKATNSDGSPKYPDFISAMQTIKESQEDILITNASHGLYHAGFAGLMAKNIIGWAEKVERTDSVTITEPTKDMDPKDATNNYQDMINSD